MPGLDVKYEEAYVKPASVKLSGDDTLTRKKG